MGVFVSADFPGSRLAPKPSLSKVFGGVCPRGHPPVAAAEKAASAPGCSGALRPRDRIAIGESWCSAGPPASASPRSGRRLPRNLISGQRRLRVYSGSGRALVCWTPYWNEHLYKRMTGESIEGSLFE